MEIAPQILPRVISPVLSRMALRHMRSKGLRFHLGETVRDISGENGQVSCLRTDSSLLEADMVIIAAGGAASLCIGSRGRT